MLLAGSILFGFYAALAGAVMWQFGTGTSVLALLLLGPGLDALLAWSGIGGWNGPMLLSPLQMLWALTAPPGYLVLDPWRSHALGLLAAGLLGWLGLAVVTPRLRRGPR